MSEVPDRTVGDEGGLGALLVLLNGAADSFRTVQVTYRIWRHEQRLLEAFRDNTEKQKRRGASISTVSAVRIGDPGPPETEETVRIWREGQRVRQERHGGLLDGSYGVVDGPLWWSWSEQMGATSNQDYPSVGGGFGQELRVMLNPRSLLSLLRFQVAGESQVVGRATITVHAIPQAEGLSGGGLPGDPHARRDLHALGSGADNYQIEVDQQRGMLLAATAIRDEQPFYKITTLAISFDEPIPAETFQFEPPEGEQIQSPLEIRDRLQHHVTPTEAQRRAAFTVVIPAGGSAGWHVHCTFVEACQRPPVPAYVLLGCRSRDGQHSVSIVQMSRADASQRYRNTIVDESWQEVVREGISIKVKPAGEWPHRSQAHLRRNGTFLHLSSDNLTADELATIAAGLRPAPDTDGA